MRVSTPGIFQNVERNLQRLAEELQRVNMSLSSGRKYGTISDHPVDVGALMGLGEETAQVSQYQRNLETAREWLQSTDSALSTIEELVRGAMTLANQMATGTYTAPQRLAAAAQVQGLLEEVMQVGNTRFRGNYLLGGYRTDTAPFAPTDWEVQPPELTLQAGSTGAAVSGGAFTGSGSRTYLMEMVAGGGPGTGEYRVSADGGQTWTAPAVIPAGPAPLGGEGAEVTMTGSWVAGDRFSVAVYQPVQYQGDDHTFEIGIGPRSRLAVNAVGSQAVGGRGGPLDLFRLLARLKSSLEANDPGGVGRVLADLRSYQGRLTAELARVGASQERVETKNGILVNLKARLVTATSNIGDTDMVEAVNALKSLETAYQGALLASSQVMKTSLLDYL
jgi:flagellar hook-associated protein 3 FlgL